MRITMFPEFAGLVAAGILLALLTVPVKGAELWSLYEPACNANGIDPAPCRCILDEVVKAHGERAARYVALDMSLMYDEAAAVIEAIGEDEAFAASETFDVAQNKHCTAGRMARLQGAYSNPGSSGGASSVSMSGSVGASPPPGSDFKTIGVMAGESLVLDLRAHAGNVVCDVSVQFGEGVSPTGASADLRSFIGFYRIADANGGIDTNGDGRGDLSPNDPGYGNQVHIRAETTKLYVSKSGGQRQYLGEIHLQGGALYAPYYRYKVAGRGSFGLPAGLSANPADREKMERFLRNGMSNPTSLFYVFASANADGLEHFAARGGDHLGFKQSPGPAVPASEYDDVIFQFKCGL